MKILALDIGGTFIKAASWTDGKLSAIEEHETQARLGGAQVLERLIRILKNMGDCDAIGVDTTGQIDAQRGLVLYANENMPAYTGTAIGPALEKRFGVPVAVENDVNAAAIGEGVYGAAAGYADYLCLTYGTGVGGGIVIGKKLYRGFCGAAGEVGSIITHGEDVRNGDGRAAGGRYEEYASTKALIEKAGLADPAIRNGRQLFEKLADPCIRRTVEEWVWEISHGLVTLIHTFNPRCIVLGGGVMSQDYVVERIGRVTRERVMPCFREVDFKKAELGNAAGLWGMVHLAREKYQRAAEA